MKNTSGHTFYEGEAELTLTTDSNLGAVGLTDVTFPSSFRQIPKVMVVEHFGAGETYIGTDIGVSSFSIQATSEDVLAFTDASFYVDWFACEKR